jgi:hypothetical protein
MSDFAEIWVCTYRWSPTLEAYYQTEATLAHSDEDANEKFWKIVNKVSGI